MAQSHLFVMDPLSKLKPKLDTSLALAYTLTRRGHECHMVTPDALQWSIGQKPTGDCSQLFFSGDVTSVQTSTTVVKSLHEFSSIHLRQEPPFDMRYLTTTWILDAVSQDVPVWNSPEAVRRYNEKLAIYTQDKHAAAGLLTSSYQAACDFLSEYQHVICKPLDLFGGQGIFTIRVDDQAQKSQLQDALAEGPRLLQPFNDKIYEGEIRAFSVGGEPIAWCLKKPPQGHFLANTSSGATLEPYQPSLQIEAMVREISSDLLKDGLVFLGFDIIGDRVSEINVTSPRMLRAVGQWESAYEDMADWVVGHSICPRVCVR